MEDKIQSLARAEKLFKWQIHTLLGDIIGKDNVSYLLLQSDGYSDDWRDDSDRLQMIDDQISEILAPDIASFLRGYSAKIKSILDETGRTLRKTFSPEW
jgi:hypothetical protein